MMFSLAWLSAIALFSSSSTFVHGLKYTLSQVDYNLNVNKTATNPLDYSVEERANYTASPTNWRFPFYTVFLDRFVNGDPTNDNANETLFETDMRSTQIRNGGDLQGLVDSLDYIAGMGIKVIHGQKAPTPFFFSVLLLLLQEDGLGASCSDNGDRASISPARLSSTSHGAQTHIQ